MKCKVHFKFTCRDIDDVNIMYRAKDIFSLKDLLIMPDLKMVNTKDPISRIEYKEG